MGASHIGSRAGRLKHAADNVSKFRSKFLDVSFAIGVNPVREDYQERLRFRIDP